ncbi:unnamed protein product, partial [Mesorhabditis spiculigera]
MARIANYEPLSDGPQPPPAPKGSNRELPAPINFPPTLASLATKYRNEFEETIEGLRDRAGKLQDQAPKLLAKAQAKFDPIRDDALRTIQAQGDVTAPQGPIFAALYWASILATAAGLASIIAPLLLGGVVRAILGREGAFLISTIVLPAYAFWDVKQAIADGQSDKAIRFRLLGVALVEGALIGCVLQNSFLAGAPSFSFYLSVVANVYPMVVEKFGRNRQMLIGASVGAGAGALAIVGILWGSFCPPYILITALYASITAAVLQFLYRDVTNNTAPTYVHQLSLLLGLMASDVLIYLVLGMDSEAYARYRQKAR